MQKVFILVLAVLLCSSLSATAQEMEKKMDEGKEHMEHMDHKQEHMDEMGAMMPPSPLNDAWSKWMVGEWEGWSNGPMGKSKEWEKIEMGLDGQFLLRQATSDHGDMVYKGNGAITMTKDGGYAGMWVDNFRGMYRGSGKMVDGKLVMEWKGEQGTYTHSATKVSDDKYTAVWSFTDPSGQKSEGQMEMTRKEAMTSK